MPCLVGPEETSKAIRQKTLRNAKQLNTYGTRSSFPLGRGVVMFADRYQIDRHLSLPFKH